MEQLNEVNKMSQLLPTTESLLREIRKLSTMSWAKLYLEIDKGFYARDKDKANSARIWVSSAGELRKLGTGTGYLSEGPLKEIAIWALSKKWGGVIAEEVSRHNPLVPLDLIEDKKSQKNRTYQENKLLEEGFDRISIMANKERMRVVSVLNDVLHHLAPAGYSYSEILYMVHSWLLLNPLNSDRGERQVNLMCITNHDEEGFRDVVFPYLLPKNFSMPEHHNEDPYIIQCKVSPLMSGNEYVYDEGT